MKIKNWFLFNLITGSAIGSISFVLFIQNTGNILALLSELVK